MFWGDHTRAFAGLAIVSLSLVGMTACASSGGGAGSDGKPAGLTLAQTKSPVQLLRNEAASRVDEFVVDTVDGTQDLSSPCKTAEADPLGLSRSWTSSVDVSLKAGSAWRLDIVAAELVASFEEQGWTASSGMQSDVVYTSLTSDKSAATIGLSTTAADEATGTPAKLQITTKGPCVDTQGAESDEVKKLETVAAE